MIVICIGGGGIRVVQLEDGSLTGIEAVIDKDSASAVLARQIGADWLVMLTDVDAFYLDWGTDMARRLNQATPGELASLEAAAGSMGPTVLAARDFVNETGKRARIGTLEDAQAILEGAAGAVIAINPEIRSGQALRQARTPQRHSSQR